MMACFNPLRAEERGRKRRELLEAAEKGLTKISQEVARRKQKPLRGAKIAKAVSCLVAGRID